MGHFAHPLAAACRPQRQDDNTCTSLFDFTSRPDTGTTRNRYACYKVHEYPSSSLEYSFKRPLAKLPEDTLLNVTCDLKYIWVSFDIHT